MLHELALWKESLCAKQVLEGGVTGGAALGFSHLKFSTCGSVCNLNSGRWVVFPEYLSQLRRDLNRPCILKSKKLIDMVMKFPAKRVLSYLFFFLFI